MSDTNEAIGRDPDTMSDEDFMAYKDEMRSADGPLPEEAEKPEPQAKEPAEQDPEDLSDDELDAAATAEKQESVPHGRFHRERERRKALETQVSDFQRRYELLEQRTNDILRMQGQPRQQEQAPEPTYEEQYEALRKAGDFIGIQELQDKRIRDIAERDRQQRESTQQRDQVMQLANRVATAAKTDLERAIETDPSVREAYEFMREVGYRQLVEVEGVPEHIAVQQLNKYELETFHGVLSRGGRPSDFVKKFAAVRGFQQRAPEPEKPDLSTQAAEMERLNTAKLAAKTLSGGGSEARTSMPTPSDLVNMSDEDFAAFKAKYGENAMSKVMPAA